MNLGNSGIISSSGLHDDTFNYGRQRSQEFIQVVTVHRSMERISTELGRPGMAWGAVIGIRT